jgi:hypothetical protein
MSYHHGWLYLLGADGLPQEIFNHARTAAYLQSPALQLRGGARIENVLDFGGCEAYEYQPPCGGPPGSVTFPGVVGNRLSTADAAALDITGDITLIADIAPNDWATGAIQRIMGKWSSAAGNFSYMLELTAAGAIQISWTTAGSTTISMLSNLNLGSLANGERRVIRADLDVVNSTNRVATFWTAYSPLGPWTQLGATQTTAGTTSIFSGSAAFEVGAVGNAAGFAGKLYYAQVRNGMSNLSTPGGTAVLTIDPDLIPTTGSTSFSAATGQLVSIARTGTFQTEVTVGPDYWELISKVDPLYDPAPWFNERFPESGDFLGFHIEEWTGLDDRHVSRQVAPVGRPGGGGQLGNLGAAERVMKFNVLAIGLSEAALEYGYRWLATTLSGVCSTCATDKVMVRRTCPDVEALWDGVVELRDVGLVEGLAWEAPIGKMSYCFVRRLSFGMVAGDPCMYLPGTDVAFNPADAANIASCLSGMTVSTGRTNCRPTCSELPAACRMSFTFDWPDPFGAAAPVVTLTNTDPANSMPLRILAYSDPLGVGIDPSPCGLQILGELYVGPIPPYSELRWDVSSREVLYYDHTTSDWTSGYPFIGANDPPAPRWFALPCGTTHIVIEPATACLYQQNGEYMYNGVALGVVPHFPTAALSIVERVGCP